MQNSGDGGAEDTPRCALAAGNAGKAIWYKDVACSGKKCVRLAQRPLAGTKSCAAVLSDVPGQFCVRAEHDAFGRRPFWVGMRNADYRALLRVLKIPRAFCSPKRSALQSPLQCVAIAHAACCVVTCSVLRGGSPLHPLRRRGCCVRNGNVPDRCPQGAFYPKRSPLPACPMRRREEGLLLGLYVDASGLGSRMLSGCLGRLACRPCHGGAAQAGAGQSRTRKAPPVMLSSVSGW